MSTEVLKALVTGKPEDAAIAARSANKDPAIAALTGAMGKIKNILPKHITPERMLRIVTGELRTNAKLAEVAKKNPTSLVNAVCIASRCGLEIGGPNPQGHLVPHGNEIVFYPDYRGKLKLMRNSGELASVSIEPVYSNDKFQMKLGFERTIDHEPCYDGDRGEFKLIYFAATLANGERILVWMTKDQIEHVRKKSKMGNAGAWVSDWVEMAKKTVIHRASKIMPMSTEYRIAQAAEDAADDGKTISLHEEDSDLVIEGESQKVPDEEPPRIENKPTDPNLAEMRKADEKAIKTARKENKAPADKQQIPYQPGDPFSGPPQRGFLEPLVDKETSEIDGPPQGIYIDKETGEIPELTAEQLLKRFAATKDTDVLDADATLISTIKDEEMRRDLTAYYMKRRGELKS